MKNINKHFFLYNPVSAVRDQHQLLAISKSPINKTAHQKQLTISE